MNATDFAKGLREIADWYEAHPETVVPYDNGGTGHLSVYGEPETKERVAEIVRALGRADKSPAGSGDYLVISRHFNGVGLRFVFTRETVCTRRVVGTKIIPALPAQPAEPEREVEIVEWDCQPILSAGVEQ